MSHRDFARLYGADVVDLMRVDWCDDCAARHTTERRGRVILRMLPATPIEIASAWPHLYPDYHQGSASERRLYRDLKALGAVKDGSFWVQPVRRRTA